MTKTAFVTGGTGFLGLNLVEQLCQKGWAVTVMHREHSNTNNLNDFDVQRVVGELDNLESLRQAIPEEVDVIFHVAANTGAWVKLNHQQYRDNVIGTRNMVNCAIEKNAGRFVHTSSIAAFGFHDQVVDETTQSTAVDSGIHYFITKYKAELEVRGALERGLDAVIINPANILGPYDTRNWVQLFKAVKQGNLPGIPPAKGMFCYVKDVAKAHIAAAELGETGHNYLIGGIEASYEKVTHEIQKLLNQPLKRGTSAPWMLNLATHWYMFKSRFDGKEPLLTPEKTSMLTRDMLCNDGKAQRDLHFQSTDLDEMIRITYQWLVSQGII